MRLDLPRLQERLGAVLFYGLQSIYELDSGLLADEQLKSSSEAIQRIPYEALHEKLRDMVIIIPVRDEKLKLLDFVLSGIPHACQIILVSNSSRSPIDRFELEVDSVETFGSYTNRSIICVHQRDPHLARAFAEAGYEHLLDDEGLIRHGKAEGMMLGTVLARLTGRKFIGFIDSDNYFPGAILEYCRVYAAGFTLVKPLDYAMVRISWASKPKIVENNLYFAKWGRSSVITNRFLNSLVSSYTGFETEVIRTGNAGEHAMTIDLAMQLAYSSGYSIEPYQMVYLMERFGGINSPMLVPNQNDSHKTVRIYQIESRNPHMHEYKGEEHVERMIESSLSVIYHSPLCPDSLKTEIKRELHERNIRPLEEAVPQLRCYPPLASLDLEKFASIIAGHLPALDKLRESGTQK